MKKKLPIDITKVPQKDLVKYEMAKELGLYDERNRGRMMSHPRRNNF